MASRWNAAIAPDAEQAPAEATTEVAAPELSPLTGAATAQLDGPDVAATAPVAGLAVHRMVVGAADDVEERRADQIAERVVEALAGNDVAGEGHDPAQHDQQHGVRRSSSGAAGEIGAAGGELGTDDSQLIASRAGQGAPLESAAKQRLSRAMGGADLGPVRVHTGPAVKALNQRMSAAAFTVGSDIYFRDGHPDLSTGAGQRIMAHELAHAVGPDGPSVHRLLDGSEDESGGESTAELGSGQSGVAIARNKGKGKKDKKDKKDPKDKKPKKPGFFERRRIAKEEKTQKAEQAEKERLAEEQRLRDEADKQRKAEQARQAQLEIDARTTDYTGVSSMNLADLEKYVTEKPDWARHSTMTMARPARIQMLADFAAEAESGACPYSVGDLLAIGSTTHKMTATLDSLRTYGQAVQNDPFPIDQAATAAEAVAIGKDLASLLAGFPRWVLAAAMTQETFKGLRKATAIDDVIAYYQGGGGMQPIFQAEDGADFQAYLAMRTRDKVDPRTYQAGELKAYIRNFHRFESRLLDRLILNFKDSSKKKPLTLILHTALDHNGAFHRDPELFRVVRTDTNNTLMIEGGDTLDTYKSQITPLAKAYGVNDKIDQVMFAGHGNAQSMELAGGVEENSKGKLGQTGEDLDVSDGASDKTKTEELFDAVLANMDGLPNLKDPKQPHRRLLFNACLTNSNIVATNLTGDEANGRKQIREWIAKNMSLATFLNDRAKKQNKDVTALGANASINQVELIDKKGGLDLVTKADPKVTAPKLEYAQYGKEPTGVLRAAVESFGNDETAAISAMKARIKATTSTSSFDDLIIWACYANFIDYHKANSATGVNELRIIAEMAEDFSHLQSASHASFERLRRPLQLGWGKRILDTVLQYSAAAKEQKQGLMLNVARLALQPAEATLQNTVLTLLDDPFWTVKSAQVDEGAGRYLDITLLDQIGALPAMLTGAPTHGKLVLALAGQLSKTKPAACTTYLQGLRKPLEPEVPGLALAPEVPPVPEQDAPRGPVPEVPAVPGRAKVDKIDGQRKEYPAIPDLAKLEALADVPAPKDKKKPVKAPGRAGRPKRDAVDAVPAVQPYFEAALNIDALLGGASTVGIVLKSL